MSQNAENYQDYAAALGFCTDAASKWSAVSFSSYRLQQDQPISPIKPKLTWQFLLEYVTDSSANSIVPFLLGKG